MRFGIDLGGTKTEIIAIDKLGTECYRHRIPSPQGSYQATLDAITQLVLDTEAKLNCQGTVGIGIPGSISPQPALNSSEDSSQDTSQENGQDNAGKVKNANSTWLIGNPLQADLEEQLARPIRIANDADCFALSEASDGAAAGEPNVFGVILGTGVGGGIVINGQLVSGPNAIAGEWGHNPLPWAQNSLNGKSDKFKDPLLPCYCGKQGCIETFLSGPGFSKHYALAGGNSDLNAKDIIAAIETDDIAHKSYNEYLDRLARSLATVINILDPNVIVLGGGMSNVDRLYKDLPNALPAYVFSDSVNTRIVKAMYGDSSGVRGAAWLWPHTE